LSVTLRCDRNIGSKRCSEGGVANSAIAASKETFRTQIISRGPNKSILTGTLACCVYWPVSEYWTHDNLVDTMKKILLATVATLALATPSFAVEPEKTVGQAPQSFYLAQDTATMKCEIVETQPVAGGKVRVIGAAHATKAAAETALKADKACVN